MSDYSKIRAASKSGQEHYQNTLSRLKQIQDQFKAPGSGRLAGKVAIVTGVGSLKGIGYVEPPFGQYSA